MRRTINSVLIVTMFLICATAFGQQRGNGNRNGGGRQMRQAPSVKEILSRLDTNGDNLIDKGEAAMAQRGNFSEMFDSFDANNDGFLDIDELEAIRNGRKNKNRKPKLSAKKIFDKIDNNKDGFLDELEVAAKEEGKIKENFSVIDSNADNLIDVEELKVYLEEISKEKSKKKKDRRK